MSNQGGWAPGSLSDWSSDRPAVPSQAEPLAWASLALGVASFVLLPFIGGIAAIVTGEAAKRAIDKSHRARTGRRYAVAGEALGIVNVVVTPIVILILVMTLSAGNHVRYNRLRTGSCYNNIGGSLFPASVDQVDCSKPHRAEVTGRFEATDSGNFPGPEGFRSQAVPRCSTLALAYLGRFSPRGLRNVWLAPDQSLWNRGTHTVVCAVGDATGGLRAGSVHG